MKFKEKENRPWGAFYVIHDELNYKLKRIEVNPNSRLSYQYHNKRSECWTIVEGSGLITIDEVDMQVSQGESITIKKGSKHRIYNNTSENLVFIEVQTGSYFGEDDIVRIEDDYNR
jgi:mannose-6-phosphate isomerase